METILIESVPYDAYADVADADGYLAAAFHAANWTSATETTKAQALITATRILDRQVWLEAYDTQAKREVVADIVDASVEMALALVDGSEFQTEQNTSQKLQSIKAGSVALTFFRGAEGATLRFPLIVHELLSDYISGQEPTLTGVATGVDGISSTGSDFGFTDGV